MNDICRVGVTKRWSDVVVFGGLAYFVEVPDDANGSPNQQFEQIFRQMDARLTEIGSNRQRLIQVLVYLPYAEDLPIFNELWDAWVPMGHAPSRACTHPPLASSGYRVELVITAAIASS